MQSFFDNDTPEERRLSEQPVVSRPTLGRLPRPQPLFINTNDRFDGLSSSNFRGLNQNTFGGLGNSHSSGRNNTNITEGTLTRLYSPLQPRPSACLPLVFPNIPQSSKPTTQGSNRSVVYMSRQEAIHWREKSKNAWPPWNRTGVAIRGEWVLKSLDARDSVFIVDDSESMQRHWPDMTELVRIIAYMVKRYDEDGIDFYFTSSTKKHNLPENQVGLQFISFGDSSECLDRLKLVDNYLVSQPEFRFDIVDTTPSYGNLYKIIRGAFDRD